MWELNMEKSKKIGQLGDKVRALKSMLEDLQIHLVKQTSQPTEEILGFDLNRPLALNDWSILQMSTFKCIFLLSKFVKFILV